MISLNERKELEKLLQFSDYKTAAAIYTRNTGKFIYYRYLEKFIKGHRKASGERPGTHRPLDMYIALAEAERQRREAQKVKEMKDEEMTAKAREIRERLAA